MNQDPPKQASLGSLFAYLRPHRSHLIQGGLLLVLTNALSSYLPYLLKGAVDDLAAKRFVEVQQGAAVIVVTALVMAVCRIASRIRVFNVGRDVEFDLRNDVLSRLHRLGPSFFQRMPTGDVMSRAINDLGQVRAMVGFGSLNAANALVAYPVTLAFMLSMSAELTLVALAPYPVLVIVARYLGRMMFSRSRAQQEALGLLSSRVQEQLAGVRVVRAFGNDAAQHARFSEANEQALRTNMALVIIRGSMWPLLLGLGAIGTLLLLYRGLAMVEAGELTVGELIAFLAYGESLRWPTMGLGYIMAVVQRGRASYARVRQILDAEPDVVEEVDARMPGQTGELSVRGLRYAYGGTEVLHGLSFDAPANQMIAVVGRTGSGKSTLSALLSRLLPTAPGQVFLDGDDVTKLRLEELRRTIGVAQQEPFLFSDSIARNIGYSLDDPYSPESMARIREAAREACILDEIEELPAGFDTLVGERGVQLSGGQKQRIALARALLNEPRVLVMDDPLSAVDAKTEARILEALERAGRGKTLVLITNRVAAARRAHQVVVLEQGRIVEQGTHEALLRRGGLYAALAERQQLEEALTAL